MVKFICNEVASDMPVIWTVHPRSVKLLRQFGLLNLLKKNKRIILLQPLGYHEMLHLNMDARIILTDSGGLQEECTILGTPCLTLRQNTERPITLRENGGASILAGNNINRIRVEYKKILLYNTKLIRPELWDGRTAERCLQAILNFK